MATSTSIPFSQYLTTTYRPDCDDIDGEVKERTLRERSHAYVQAIIVALFNQNRRAWSIVAGAELRVRVSATRICIPDVCVTRRSDPPDPVVLVAPLICIEILSPADTLASTQERCAVYFRMGVPHVWIVDPIRRLGFVASPEGPAQSPTEDLSVPHTPIHISLDEVFTELEDMLVQDWTRNLRQYLARVPHNLASEMWDLLPQSLAFPLPKYSTAPKHLIRYR